MLYAILICKIFIGTLYILVAGNTCISSCLLTPAMVLLYEKRKRELWKNMGLI